MLFLPIDEKNPFPLVNFEVLNIDINPDNWDFHIDFKLIPEWLIDWIFGLFKSKVLKEIVPKVSA